MRLSSLFAIGAAALAVGASAQGFPKYNWKYYRPGNTGIQGDFNEAIWIGPDNDPWIGGYDPLAEEGGIAKFIQGQNRWVNISNIDYAVIGSANDTGYCRATDMVQDQQGNLWIGTYRGALRMNPNVGPQTLVRFGPDNGGLPGGVTQDVALAPDGSIWISASSSQWGGGGLSKFNPATNTWTHILDRGGDKIAIQPKPGGGYYLWASQPGYTAGNMDRWDSTTGTWTSYGVAIGNPAHLSGKDTVDAAGNLWMTRWTSAQNEETLQIRKPDGTWVTPPLPPVNGPVSFAAVRPYGNMQCLLIDGFMQLQRFNGTSWTNLGQAPHSGFVDDLDQDSAGNVWLCGSGTGGALKWTASTGTWQRYRITNTCQFDLFNADLSLDPASGAVYAAANANPDVGGMVKWDGTRWTGFVTALGHGLTAPWPFTSPQSEAVYVRPSNGRVVVNPLNSYSHEFNGTTWTALSGGPDQVQNYVEDSGGRLWCASHYGGYGYFQNGVYKAVDAGVMFNEVYKDTRLPSTIWAVSGPDLIRTNGVTKTVISTGDFPELASIAPQFNSFAMDGKGKVYAGTYSPSGGNALVKVDSVTGAKQVLFQHGVNWPFPGEYVMPLGFSPDGRLWMAYGKEYPFDDMGLLWWDGKKTGVFQAPPNGEWRFGGLPHYIFTDFEIRPTRTGYELWMALYSRGLAVLNVRYW